MLERTRVEKNPKIIENLKTILLNLLQNSITT